MVTIKQFRRSSCFVAAWCCLNTGHNESLSFTFICFYQAWAVDLGFRGSLPTAELSSLLGVFRRTASRIFKRNLEETSKSTSERSLILSAIFIRSTSSLECLIKDAQWHSSGEFIFFQMSHYTVQKLRNPKKRHNWSSGVADDHRFRQCVRPLIRVRAVRPTRTIRNLRKLLRGCLIVVALSCLQSLTFVF